MWRYIVGITALWSLACGGSPPAPAPPPRAVAPPAPTEAAVVAQLPADCGPRGRPQFADDGTVMVICNSSGHHGPGRMNAEQLRALMASTESLRFFTVPELAEARPAVLLPISGHGSALAADGKHIALADFDDRLVVMPTDGGPPTVDRVVEGLSFPISVGTTHVAYTTEARSSASDRFHDVTAHVITFDGAEVGSFAATHDVFGVSIGPDGIVYLVQNRGRVDRWDPATRTLLSPLQVPAGRPGAFLGAEDVAFAPDGSAIAVVSSTGHYGQFALPGGNLVGSGQIDWNPTTELGVEIAAAWSGRLYVKASKDTFAACDPATGFAVSTHHLPELDSPRLTASRDGAWLLVGRSLVRAP